MNDKERIVKLVQRRADVLLKCLHECKETMPMGKYLRKQAMYSTCLWLLEKINAMPNIEQKPTSDTRYEVKVGDGIGGIYNTPFDYEHATITQKDFAPKDYHAIDPHFGISVEDLMSKSDIKPKFKVGDWIVNNNSGGVYQVKGIRDDEYCLWPLYAEIQGYLRIIDVDIDYHLWTIEDAEDGDVLVNGSNIFIFHFINDTRLMGYCHVNVDDGRFYDDIGKNECFCLIDAVVNPATKEQRELLFKKMNEAGYEWNADKKELEKIEQKQEWSEEDERNMNQTLYFMQGGGLIQGKKDILLDWLKSIKCRMKGKEE